MEKTIITMSHIPVVRGAGLVQGGDFHLSPLARQSLSDLFHGLTADGADNRLADGGKVTTAGHALEWLLQQIATKFP